MKHFILQTAKAGLLSLGFLVTMSAIAQKKEAYEMNIAGVKVIVQPSDNEIVEIQTVIKGGVQNYPEAKQGIEQLAISALTECGTKDFDKNTFKNNLDKVSASIYGSAGMDFATVGMNCILSDFEDVWRLYAAALTTPAFDAKEFERIKQDAINNLKSQASQPDYAAEKLAKKAAFKGRDYAKSPEGTEATVSKLTVEETKAYYQSILTKAHLVIVVVGEVDKDVLTQKITALLQSIPDGTPFQLKKQSYSPTNNSFLSEKSDLATNYIQGVSGAPLPGTPDYNAFNLAMRILYSRHFLEVRSKNGLSYAPATWFDGGTSASSNFFVSTTEPNKYIAVLNQLLTKVKKEGFTEAELKNIKTSYLTGFFYRQETNGAQAGSLVANEVLHDNWRRALTINNDMKKVTVQDLNNAFNKYVTNITWAYRGNTAKVTPALYTTSKAPAPKPLPKPKLSTTKKQ